VTPEKLSNYSRVTVPLTREVNDYAELYIRLKTEGKSAAEVRLMDLEFVK
jgi:hypothetical protein